RRIEGNTATITTILGIAPPGPGTAGRPASPRQGSADGDAAVRPQALAVDASGNVYVSDRVQHGVLRLPVAGGPATTVAGGGVAGYVGAGGPATGARLASPEGLALDRAGNLFIADRGNSCVRRVDARTGVIATVAGLGLPGDAGDGGPATAAQLREPVA